MNVFIQLSELQAALFWNAALVLALVLVLFMQWSAIKAAGLDTLTAFVAIAVFNTALLTGARLGALEVADWQAWWNGQAMGHSGSKSLFAGLLFALPAYWMLKKLLHLGWAHADALFVALPLGAGIGRLGCAAAGCCYGVISHSDLAWTYGPGMPAYDWQVSQGLIAAGAEASLGVMPVQLLFTLSNLLLFLFLWRIRRYLKTPGSLALLSIALIFLNRFGLEFWREAATDRGILGEWYGGLKVVQWFCLIVGLSAFVFFWRRQQRGIRQAEPVEPAPLLPLSLVLFSGVFAVALFKDLLSLDELLLLLISALPALILLVRELWVNWAELQRPLATAMFSSGIGLLMMFTTLDTIPAMQKGEHWLTIGGSATSGSFKEVYRNCDGDIIGQEKIKWQTGTFDATYYYPLGPKTNMAVGLRGEFGGVRSDSLHSSYNYSFSAINPYFAFNHSWIGFTTGPIYLHRQAEAGYASNYFVPKETYQKFYLRLGAIHKYYYDLEYNTFPSLDVYPYPTVSSGIVNWGFNDRSGTKNIRLGLAVMENQTAFLIGGKVPLGKTMLHAEGTLYMYEEMMFNLGIKYHWQLRKLTLATQ